MNKKFFKSDDFVFGWYDDEDVPDMATKIANIKIEPLLKQLKEAREIIEMHAKHGSPASKEFLERWKGW